MMLSRAPRLGRDVRVRHLAAGRKRARGSVRGDHAPERQRDSRPGHRPVARIARRIVAVADHADRDWHLYVVDDSLVNAFALAGGHVFVFVAFSSEWNHGV